MTAPTVRSKDEIPDAAYRTMVLTLMDKQASREVATAEVFGQCVLYARVSASSSSAGTPRRRPKLLSSLWTASVSTRRFSLPTSC